MGDPPGPCEQVVMTLRGMAYLFGRPIATLQYWAYRRGIKRVFRDEYGSWFPLEPFRMLHERRRKWRGRTP